MGEMTWDQFEARSNGRLRPKHPQEERGYKEVFEAGDAVVFPQHPDDRVRGIEYRVSAVGESSMHVGHKEEDSAKHQEIPDHRLVMWEMRHAPSYWREQAQRQIAETNGTCHVRLEVEPGISLECRLLSHQEGPHINSMHQWAPGEQCSRVEPATGRRCLSTVPEHLVHQTWNMMTDALGAEWEDSHG